MNRSPRVVLALLLILLFPRALAADGKVFSSTEVIPVLPDQAAIIAWRDGVQTLVIETSFQGTGDEFAWLVPLPARPEIFEASSGAIKTIRWQLRPTVLRPLETAFWIFMTLVLASGVLVFTWERARVGAWAACGLCALLLYVVLAAGIGGARSASVRGGIDGVEQLVRTQLAGRDVAVLEARDAAGLAAWLRGNGFSAPAGIDAVVQAYCDEGWVFVASRLLAPNASRQTELRTIRPLGFRFPAARPVYPMRLTGVTDAPLKVELFIFGESRAAAPDFVTTDCGHCLYPDGDRWSATHAISTPGREIRIGHAELASIAAGLPVVSRLEATLTPAQMARDVAITWSPFEHAARTVAGHDHARSVAVLAACAGALIAMVVVSLHIASRRRSGKPQRIGPGLHIALAAACSLLIGLAMYTLLRPADTFRRLSRWSYLDGWSHYDARDAACRLHTVVQSRIDVGIAPDIAWARVQLREAIIYTNSQNARAAKIDPDAVLAIGDAPGGIEVREVPSGLQVRYFDSDGTAQEFDPLSMPPPDRGR